MFGEVKLVQQYFNPVFQVLEADYSVADLDLRTLKLSLGMVNTLLVNWYCLLCFRGKLFPWCRRKTIPSKFNEIQASGQDNPSFVIECSEFHQMGASPESKEPTIEGATAHPCWRRTTDLHLKAMFVCENLFFWCIVNCLDQEHWAKAKCHLMICRNWEVKITKTSLLAELPWREPSPVWKIPTRLTLRIKSMCLWILHILTYLSLKANKNG